MSHSLQVSLDGYKHQSSESRTDKGVLNTLPHTPAKQVKLTEKILTNSTPRPRHLSESTSMMSVTKTHSAR